MFAGSNAKPESISWAAFPKSKRHRSLRLPTVEFVPLHRIEVQKEIVQHSPTALTVIMGLEHVGINIPPLSAEK